MPGEIANAELPYIAAVLLWLAGVVIVVVRKLV
jgi:hypothetical protein